MTPEEQRIAIAEACGWKREPLYDDEPNGRKAYRHDDRRVVYLRDLPDYLNDLNAMHEAEKVLNVQQLYDYTNYYLYKVTGGQRKIFADSEVVNATAPQRAEAFLRTIGKWKPNQHDMPESNEQPKAPETAKSRAIGIRELLADTSSLDFIAYMFYATDCHHKQQMPIRWLCMNGQLQKQYLEKARDEYLKWTNGERSAQVRRNTIG